ncbi:MAG: hypothetical protein IPN19_10505 [Elusimicrobia bacterium]|nr:hypothetical protein [Elusimicrobiota bacterium]
MAKLSTFMVGLGVTFLVPNVRGQEVSDSLLTQPVVVSTPVVPAAYVFKGDRFRDPFIPLVGASLGYEGPRASAEPISPFNPLTWKSKGLSRPHPGDGPFCGRRRE